MSAKKATKTANICATVYEGNFDITFDCVGVEVCRFALCSMMPPDGSEECIFREHGSCRQSNAKYSSLELLRNRLTKEMKKIDEDLQG